MERGTLQIYLTSWNRSKNTEVFFDYKSNSETSKNISIGVQRNHYKYPKKFYDMILKPEQNAQNWYVIKTKSFSEKKAFANLDKKKFHVFLPLIESIRQWSDRKKKVQVPLIPSVLFIYCTQRDLQLVYGEIGIVGILKYLKKPAVVKDGEIENLKILVPECTGEEISSNREFLLPGQMVEVIEGPFKGLLAESIVVNGKHRIKVKISVLHTEYMVNIPYAYVRAMNNKVA